MYKYKHVIEFIRETFNAIEGEVVPLHAPIFSGNERKYVLDAIDTTFVSSVGAYVNKFEQEFAKYVGSKYAVAVVNGTSALHLAMLVAGVKKDDLVITQSLSFISTANAITYTGAEPLFLDVDEKTMGLSDIILAQFLEKEVEVKDNIAFHKETGRRISACIPMHTFGHAVKIDAISQLCSKYNITLIEDSAESVGSYYKNKHTGTFGKLGIFSFNGNKTITCGGGGVIVTDDESLAKQAKHLSTQAKVAHAWNFEHDMIGYNYRMPNLNAAMALAQLEQLPDFLKDKRDLALKYKAFFASSEIEFIEEPLFCWSNYWLNAIKFINNQEQQKFLEESNSNKVMTRPFWQPLHTLPMFKNCIKGDLPITKMLADLVVNIPSSVRL